MFSFGCLYYLSFLLIEPILGVGIDPWMRFELTTFQFELPKFLPTRYNLNEAVLEIRLM